MALGKYSFRTILLSRLLLISVPVLLVGVYVTYRKARSAFLKTAHQNLTESAIRKTQSISGSIEALQTNLITASDTLVIKADWQEDQQKFLARLARKLPTQIQCLQLTDLETGKIRASTCGQTAIGTIEADFWSARKEEDILIDREKVYTRALPAKDLRSQLDLLVAAPVYNFENQLRYALVAKASILQKEQLEPASLDGYPVIINESGFILAHPIDNLVGKNIREMPGAEKLDLLLKNAIAGKTESIHLLCFEGEENELVAGYNGMSSPLTPEKGQKWVVLAFTPLDDALSELKEIKTILVVMTLALLGATVLGILYVASELALPIEKLRDYAINKQNLESNAVIPQDFRIKEFHQLAMALNETLEKLETAWQEAKNANQLKIEFLRTTSHELRNPLNGIIGCISVVKEDLCDGAAEEKEFLQKAYKAANHLKGIIEDILDMAKIEAGKLSVNKESVNLNKIIQEVLELQAVGIKNKGLELNVSEARDNIIVSADRGKLKQVLINAISNSVKFTPSGSIDVITTIEKKENLSGGDRQKVTVIVKDTGIGIDPQRQTKLFRPFVLVDGSTTRKFGGTGLGLAISHKLMELMGGNITLYSDGLGKGTTVTITLLLAAEDESSKVRSDIVESTTMDFSPNNILNYSSDKDI
ncbi:MAG: ATP-binding protein [Prochloraceae cyanobacterium]